MLTGLNSRVLIRHLYIFKHSEWKLSELKYGPACILQLQKSERRSNADCKVDLLVTNIVNSKDRNSRTMVY